MKTTARFAFFILICFAVGCSGRQTLPFKFYGDPICSWVADSNSDKLKSVSLQKAKSASCSFTHVAEGMKTKPYNQVIATVNAIEFAVVVDNVDAFNILATKDPNFYEDAGYGLHLLHLAAARGSLKSIKTISQKTPIASRDDDGCTALDAAVINGHTETVRFLLDKKAPTGNVCAGSIPIVAALNNRRLAVFTLLLARKANTTVDPINGSLMHLCVVSPEFTAKCLKYLPKQLNSIDPKGNTPLHIAAKSGTTESVKVLLAAKAHKKIKNKKGDTPYGLATLPAVRDLLKN